MNRRFKLHPDGTLEITMPKGVKVGRVLVCEEGTQNGKLYYPEPDVPDTNVGDMISRQAAINAIMGEYPESHYPAWYAEILKKLPSAEPEIIHCKDCKYEDGVCYCELLFMDVKPDGFCYLADKKIKR